VRHVWPPPPRILHQPRGRDPAETEISR
jgi:hypothetical protein